MPGNVPPDPWEDPRGYLTWYADKVAAFAAAGDLVGLNKFVDTQRETIDTLRG